METKFNFNSSPCTSIEQSKRLLALGLKKETADMALCEPFDYEKRKYSDGYAKIVLEEGEDFCKEDIPAWSLHRLMCLVFNSGGARVELFEDDDAYEILMYNIEMRIKEGCFEKEYLV